MKIDVHEKKVAQKNPFGTAYMEDFDKVSSFFHYSPYKKESYKQRIDELGQRNFDRKSLAKVIRTFHSKWGLTEEVKHQLARLEQEESVVVVGGQQAGLLGGPLYTLHKAITLIQLAKQQEKQLGVPVIPLFWIAGEDHDFLEVNHVYLPKAEGPYLSKHTLEDEHHSLKIPLSHRTLSKERTFQWIDQFFDSHPETEFTREIRANIEHMIKESHTYVDFFAQLIAFLFGRFGLLMVDSGDRTFRMLQSETFIQIIENYQLIDEQVRLQMNEMEKNGFTPQVQLGDVPALLFIYEEGERHLLESLEGRFQTKDGRYTYSMDELIRIAREEPWRLSNNVITRPFMQESLFPTLAFVGGPGEIAYWALYHSYFNCLGMRLPILAPRISMTLVEKPIAKTMEKQHISIDDLFNNFNTFRKEWLKQQDNLNLEELFIETKDKIKEIYNPLIQQVKGIHSGMEQLAQKNLTKIMDQVDYLEKRSTADFAAQYGATLRKFDKVEQALFPHEELQERMYNSITFLNKHGLELIELLIRHPLYANGEHKLIYI